MSERSERVSADCVFLASEVLALMSNAFAYFWRNKSKAPSAAADIKFKLAAGKQNLPYKHKKNECPLPA